MVAAKGLSQAGYLRNLIINDIVNSQDLLSEVNDIFARAKSRQALLPTIKLISLLNCLLKIMKDLSAMLRQKARIFPTLFWGKPCLHQSAKYLQSK